MKCVCPCGMLWSPVANVLYFTMSWTKISLFAVNVNELLSDNDAAVISILL